MTVSVQKLVKCSRGANHRSLSKLVGKKNKQKTQSNGEDSMCRLDLGQLSRHSHHFSSSYIFSPASKTS